MAYQPTSPIPYLGTIDSTVDNVFTCIINPRDTITQYVLKIIDINSTTGEPILTVTENESGLLYSGISEQIDTTRITDNLQLPLQGNYKTDTILRIPIPAHYILDKSAETEETDDEDRLYGDYVWNITLYDSNNKSSTSCDYYFMVRDKATVSLFNDDTLLSTTDVNVINSSSLRIRAEYSQSQNILPAYYCFNIYLNGKLTYTTGNTISSNIVLNYDSLITENNYILELLVYDDNKMQNRYIYNLSVSYGYFSAPINPTVEVDNNKSYSNVDYSDNISIVGKCEDNTIEPIYRKYILSATNKPPDGEVTNGVCVSNGQVLYWDERTVGVPLDLEDTCQFVNWHGHQGYDGIIVEKIDEDSPLNNIIVGHTIPNSIMHSDDSLLYIDENDSFMPIGVLSANIQGGFYYKFGTLPITFISEFVKITSAIYKSDGTKDENEATAKIQDDTLYVINNNDTLEDTNILLTNDAPYNYWWLIGILKDTAVVYQGEKYSETVVSE